MPGRLAAGPDRLITHRVVVVDRHGAFGPRPAVVAWLDGLVTVTRALPPVVAHLLGGAIAVRHAVDDGDRLAHLVLVDTMWLALVRPSLRFAVPMVGPWRARQLGHGSGCSASAS